MRILRRRGAEGEKKGDVRSWRRELRGGCSSTCACARRCKTRRRRLVCRNFRAFPPIAADVISARRDPANDCWMVDTIDWESLLETRAKTGAPGDRRVFRDRYLSSDSIREKGSLCYSHGNLIKRWKKKMRDWITLIVYRKVRNARKATTRNPTHAEKLFFRWKFRLLAMFAR